MCICIYIGCLLCMQIYACIRVHAYTHTCINTCREEETSIGWLLTMCMYAFEYIHTHIHSGITCIHWLLHMEVYMYIHANAYIYARKAYIDAKYTHTHTYVNMHIHTYIQGRNHAHRLARGHGRAYPTQIWHNRKC